MDPSHKDQKDDGRKDKKTDRPPVKEPDPVFGLPLGLKKPIEVTVPEELAVVLTPMAFSQLFGFAYATDLEISLLGIVEREKSLFSIREFFLVEQKGAHSHTELEPSAVGELVERLITEGRSDDAKRLRCWAHSHPGMDTFWSRTDDDNCRRMTSDWLVSIVVSDKFKIRCRLDVASPVPFTFDHLPVFCESPVDAEVAERCKAEVKEKLKHVPLFGLGKTKDKKEKDKMPGATETAVELAEYCELCGQWHSDDQCPMELESSAFQLVHDERAQERAGVFEDDVWF